MYVSTKNKHLFGLLMFLKKNINAIFRHMNMFTQKYNKLVAKISSQNYKQTHIPVPISL